MSNILTIELNFKYRGDVETSSTDSPVECSPYHTLRDVIDSFMEGTKPFLWFRFLDSRLEWLCDTKQSVASYVKTNGHVIYYKKHVELKFRELPKSIQQFNNWCLYHGRKIDVGPTPECAYAGGIDSEMKLMTVFKRFFKKYGFMGYRIVFLNSDGEGIFETYPQDINLEQFFMLNGPMIFYFYLMEEVVDNFYLDASHNPHNRPKRFKHCEGMTVDMLSRRFIWQHSSLMAIENGNIVGFVDANAPVKTMLQQNMKLILGDLHNNHSSSEDHFDVSVQFKNGGDLFINPILVCAMTDETIETFSQRLLTKIVQPDRISVCLHSLKICIDGVVYECNSTEKITKPESVDLGTIPVYTVDAKRLQSDLKYCDSPYVFYFYDKMKPSDRVRFIFGTAIAYNPAKLSTVIDSFIEENNFTSNEFAYFDSRGNQIGPKEMSLTVSQFTRKNDLVIHYVKTKGDTENNNDMEIESEDNI